MVKAQRAFIVGLAILLVSACAFAQGPSLDVSQYAHTPWKVRDGFPKGGVFSIAQTPDGYLWLGTESGLFRFDGVRSLEWQPPAGNQLPDHTISALLAARDGTLWVGTLKGLFGWQGGKVTSYPELAGRAIFRLLEDREGTVWVATHRVPLPDLLCAIRSRAVHCYGEDGSLGNLIVGLYEDRTGTLWVGLENGFWRWKPGTREFFSMPPQPNGIRAFAESDDGALLVGTGDGLKRLSNGRLDTYALPNRAQGAQTEAMLRDRDGGLWIGTYDRGLLHVHHGKADVFSQADGLSSDWVVGLFEDREGGIWVATNDGLDRFRPYSVPTVSIKQGLSNGNAYSVLATTDGSVWVGTSNGLNRWKDGQISSFGGGGGKKSDGKLDGLPPNSLFQDSSGRIWISTQRGLGYLQDSEFISVRGVPGGVVHGLAEISQGHLWIANQQAGLFHLFQGKVVQQIPWHGLGHDDFAQAMVADPSGRGLWLGFLKGGVAYVVDGGVRTSYSTADGLGKGTVNELRLLPTNELWAATEGGLSRIKDGHVLTLTRKNGLPCDGVHWSMEDDDRSIWISMPCGLVRILKSDLDAWVAKPSRVIKASFFDISDGVRSHYSAGGYKPLVTKSLEGKLWFATWDGVSVIDPHHLAFNKIPPPVHIEQISVDGKTYDPANGLRLPPLVRNLEIRYTALSLVAPEKNHFRFRLEGQDKDWREVVNDRTVQYSNLAPGSYHFRVLASNNSGVWNEQGAVLDFSIAPAYYQTTWFRALCVITFAAMLWTAYLLRVRALNQRQAVLERNQALLERHRLEVRALNEDLIKAQEAERMRIAGELHDGLLQQLTSFTLRLSKVRRHVPPDSEATATVNALQQELVKMGSDVRHISHELHPPMLQDAGLPDALCAYCEEFSKVRGVFVSCETDASVKDLSPGAALCLYRIAQEAMGNAAKHAAPKKIDVRLTRSNGQVCLTVTDDGIGFDPHQTGKPRGLGLINMRERALQLHGTFDFESYPGRGTTVTAAVPFRPAS